MISTKPAVVPANSLQFHEISQLRREISVLVDQLSAAPVTEAPRWFEEVALQIVAKAREIHALRNQVIESQLEIDWPGDRASPFENRQTFMSRMFVTT